MRVRAFSPPLSIPPAALSASLVPVVKAHPSPGERTLRTAAGHMHTLCPVPLAAVMDPRAGSQSSNGVREREAERDREGRQSGREGG